MTTLLFLWWVYIHFVWVIGAGTSLFLIAFHSARLRRGIIRRWLTRHVTWYGVEMVRLMLVLSFVSASFAVMFVNGPASAALIAIYWTGIGVWDVIDYITGGDDPGRRFRRAADALRKLRIAPPPKPVVDLIVI